MSLFRRIRRYFQAQPHSQLAMSDRVGIGGEQYAAQFLAPLLVVSRVANPVLPHPNKPNLFLESDFLLYAAGTLFCLEIKNYRGIICPANGDPGQIVQQKIGRYGEEIPAKLHQNPLRQAKSFVFHLKRYLATHVDPRFNNLFIVAVAAFVRNGDTDISPIWNFSEGIIYVDELPAFFHSKRNPKYAANPSKWVLNGMQWVPRPDVIVTLAGDELRGFLTHSHLTFRAMNAQPVMIPFAEISQVRLSRSGNFSDFDDVAILFRNSLEMRYFSIEGTIRLRTLHGQIVSKHLHNIASIVPGRALIVPASRKEHMSSK